MSVGRRMQMASAGYLSEVTTELFSGDSQVNSAFLGSWSNPANVIDGNESTYSQFSSSASPFGTITSGAISITFPAINAREIIAVRVRCRGQGATTGLGHSLSFLSAADLTTFPATSGSINWKTPSIENTVDTGLITTDYTLSNSLIYVNIAISELIGTGAPVLNYWAGGARVSIVMNDFNGGGIAGKNYGPLLQIQYKPK